jgi:hypothetical protein
MTDFPNPLPPVCSLGEVSKIHKEFFYYDQPLLFSLISNRELWVIQLVEDSQDFKKWIAFKANPNKLVIDMREETINSPIRIIYKLNKICGEFSSHGKHLEEDDLSLPGEMIDLTDK